MGWRSDDIEKISINRESKNFLAAAISPSHRAHKVELWFHCGPLTSLPQTRWRHCGKAVMQLRQQPCINFNVDWHYPNNNGNSVLLCGLGQIVYSKRIQERKIENEKPSLTIDISSFRIDVHLSIAYFLSTRSEIIGSSFSDHIPRSILIAIYWRRISKGGIQAIRQSQISLNYTKFITYSDD